MYKTKLKTKTAKNRDYSETSPALLEACLQPWICQLNAKESPLAKWLPSCRACCALDDWKSECFALSMLSTKLSPNLLMVWYRNKKSCCTLQMNIHNHYFQDYAVVWTKRKAKLRETRGVTLAARGPARSDSSGGQPNHRHLLGCWTTT